MIDFDLPLRTLDQQIADARAELQAATFRLAQLKAQRVCLLKFNENSSQTAIQRIVDQFVRDLGNASIPPTKIVNRRRVGGKAAKAILAMLNERGKLGADGSALCEAVIKTGLTASAASKARDRLKQKGQIVQGINDRKKFYATAGLLTDTMVSDAADANTGNRPSDSD